MGLVSFGCDLVVWTGMMKYDGSVAAVVCDVRFGENRKIYLPIILSCFSVKFSLARTATCIEINFDVSRRAGASEVRKCNNFTVQQSERRKNSTRCPTLINA